MCLPWCVSALVCVCPGEGRTSSAVGRDETAKQETENRNAHSALLGHPLMDLVRMA